jgi:acetate kinase
MLLSGAVEAIGHRESRFRAQDARQGAVVSGSISIPSLREAILRIAALLADSKMPAPVIHWASNRAWRAKTAAALPD